MGIFVDIFISSTCFVVISYIVFQFRSTFSEEISEVCVVDKLTEEKVPPLVLSDPASAKTTISEAAIFSVPFVKSPLVCTDTVNPPVLKTVRWSSFVTETPLL